MTPADLASQRWFRSKQRSIVTVTEVDRAPIGPGALVVLEVTFDDDGAEHYLVPLVGGREPADGDGLWSAMAEAIEGEAPFGRFVTRRAAGFGPGPLDERRLAVEQSNTSVVLGERLIVKLYRLLEPGENPDVEVNAFLARVGFPDTPALAGSVTYEADGSRASAAILQAYVAGAEDAFASMRSALATDPRRGVEVVERMGDLTARLHRALASRPDDAAFPARHATVEETAAWRASAERQTTLAVEAVRGAEHERLVAVGPAVRARFADAFGSATGGAAVSRIHGDYHLGQLLARPDGGLVVIDFEGEPSRPLAERRAATSPLRDVAGMLRSLDYAARTAERDGGDDAEAWLGRARDAFLGAYGDVDAALLSAFELEKACYEIRYEASMRPDWLWLPLAAVERLAS
jgi:maltose alpha-D-glucosyltransferase/alpha-amylase